MGAGSKNKFGQVVNMISCYMTTIISNMEVIILVTLILNHPESQVIKNKKKPFFHTFTSGIGEGYYIPQTLLNGITIW